MSIRKPLAALIPSPEKVSWIRDEGAMEFVRMPYPNTTKAGGAQPVWRDSFKKSVYYQGLDLPEKKIAKKCLNYEIQLLGYT